MSATKTLRKPKVAAESHDLEDNGHANGHGNGNGNGNGLTPAHSQRLGVSEGGGNGNGALAEAMVEMLTEATGAIAAIADSPVIIAETPGSTVRQAHRPEEDRGTGSPQVTDGSTGSPQVMDTLTPMDETELKAILEALLFVSHEPLTTDRAVAVLGISRAEAVQGFRQLQQQYDREERGIQVVEIAGGFRLATRAEFAPWVKRLEKIKPAPKLSRSALETLAIVSYRQPIVRSEIESIRGVETSGVLRTLLERKLIRMVGRKEVPGRPIMYGTTKFFLEHFGLRDLSELPPLRELKDLGEAEGTFLPMEGEEPLTIGETPAS